MTQPLTDDNRQPFRLAQSVEKLVFRQTVRVQKGGKTSKPSSSAYDGTVELGLRCKSKCLAKQALEVFWLILGFCSQQSIGTQIANRQKISILTIGDFLDTLNGIG